MGIAVLLGGGDGDRYAVLYAVALAQRTGEIVHGIRRESSLPSPPSDTSFPPASGLTLLMQRADAAGVGGVRCHVVKGTKAKDLLELLREERITCLIVGAKDEAEGKRAEKELEGLRRSITSDRRWSMRSFWAVVTGPWSAEAMAAALDEK